VKDVGDATALATGVTSTSRKVGAKGNLFLEGLKGNSSPRFNPTLRLRITNPPPFNLPTTRDDAINVNEVQWVLAYDMMCVIRQMSEI